MFVHFKSLVENQFTAKIKTLRSDGGGEFVSHHFKYFCLENGIQYQVSCPHTPQQNGIAKRKHRQIVESGLAMLHQSNLPLSYWFYAFSIVAFLINRISSSILNFLSPWQKLYHQKPPLQALRTFGCACFPLLKPYNSHKLEPKSRQCTFLGYPSQSKGYICLDVQIGKIYISCYCLFNESVFPTYPIPEPVSMSSSSSSLSSSHSFNICLSTLLPTSLMPSPPSPFTSFSSIDTPALVIVVPSTASDQTISPDVLTNFSIAIVLVSTCPPTNTHTMLTRSKNRIFKPKAYVVQFDYTCTKPPSYSVTSKFPQWIEAMDSEFFSVQQQHT